MSNISKSVLYNLSMAMGTADGVYATIHVFTKAYVENGVAIKARVWLRDNCLNQNIQDDNKLVLFYSYPDENPTEIAVSFTVTNEKLQEKGIIYDDDTSFIPCTNEDKTYRRLLFPLEGIGFFEAFLDTVTEDEKPLFDPYNQYFIEQLRPIFERFTFHLKKALSEEQLSWKNKKRVLEEIFRKDTQQSVFATLSHEFRNPLNIILGYLDFLKNTKLSKEQASYLDIISETSHGLYYTVKKIFQFVTLSLDQVIFDYQSFNLPTLFDRIENTISLYASNKNLSLRFNVSKDSGTQLIGDISKLTDILIYLIENALKFTAEGEVLVSATLISQTEDHANLRFEIKDTGKGIDPEHFDQVFSFFGQEDDSITRQYGGLGLGLSIADQYIQKMGGKIKLISCKNSGTSVIFQLQFKIDKEENPTGILSTAINKSIVQKIKVLLVDDDVYQRNIGRHILEDWNTFSVNNGMEAIAFLKQNPDTELILMDIRMPVLDGISATRIIRSELKSEAIIIAVSGEVQEATIEECLAAGMDDFVSKPFNREKLLQKVIKRLNKKNVLSDHVLHTTNPERLDGLRALVVEDDKMNQLLSARYLKDLGCKFDIAESGKIALQLFKTNPYDFVLLDLHLPDIDGFKLAQQLKQVNTNCCLIAYTGHDSDYIRKECIAAGIDNLILKQYRKAHELSMQIHEILAKHHNKADKPADALQLYNLTLIHEIVGGNQEELLDILRTFIDYTGEMLVTLEQLDPANSKDVRITAHSLISSAKQFQMEGIIPVLQRMEHESAGLSRDEISRLIIQTINFFSMAKKQMEAEFFKK